MQTDGDTISTMVNAPPGVSRFVPTGQGTGLLGSLRIRKKLMVLHTCFSVALALVLILVLRPMFRELVKNAEQEDCRTGMSMLVDAPWQVEQFTARGVDMQFGSAAALGLGEVQIATVQRAQNFVHESYHSKHGARIIRYDPASGEYFLVEARSQRTRDTVMRIYGLLVLTLLGAYLLIVLTLELFVLPRQVYQPIRRLLQADAAVRAGAHEGELIADEHIPADELGMIMRSRNRSIRRLRDKEQELSGALQQLEEVADDLKRKNFLIESAKQNMSDQDRLVSLGIMSAGLAHEMNTPLAVLKGSVERLAQSPGHGVDAKTSQLMLRVVQRLERLSESLLDFARVRPLRQERVKLREVVDEAWTLVCLDRGAAGVAFENTLDNECQLEGDSDRLTQVFVNILRNSVDALGESGSITVRATRQSREGAQWLSVSCEDDGPGIDPAVLPRLFEPFTSTRLDAKGTGLGLAVSEGIVREHGGLLLARNRRSGGAVVEVLVPVGGVDRLDMGGSSGSSR